MSRGDSITPRELFDIADQAGVDAALLEENAAEDGIIVDADLHMVGRRLNREKEVRRYWLFGSVEDFIVYAERIGARPAA